MPRNTRPPENNYGGTRRHRVEHDRHMERNFSQNNEDYYPHSSEYNDYEETRFNAEDRLAHEHRDRNERPSRWQHEERDYQPSNYSEGGHGRRVSQGHRENSDNQDYPMNRDYNRGAARKYQDSEERYGQDNRYRGERPPQDDRYRQSDWAPQDRYNEIAPDRHREATQDRYHPQLNSNPHQDFDYHYGSDNYESLEQEPRRRGRHYREY